MIRAAITAVGAYVPDEVLTNDDLSKIVDTTDEWIMTRVGIKERRVLPKGQGTSVMGAEAVKIVLEKSNTKPEEVEVIIFATTTPDYIFPSTAAMTAEACGIKNALGFDIQAACSGFIYALEIGSNFIRSGQYKKVIVVAGDKMTSIANYKDRTTCPLFGDAAGAVMLEPTTEEVGVMDSILHVDGTGRPNLHMYGGGSVYPASYETVDKDMHYVYQEGQVVFKHAVSKMADVSVEIMERNGLTKDTVDWLVPHQANIRIIEAVGNRMGLSSEKVMVNIQKYGNTSAGTIPLCLYEWEPKLKKGDNLVLAAFGGGFTWGAVYLKWAY
ncbi:3-oxoacyl-[acyl-carrier-protein] synthase-3 [Dysgonomonas sp. PFB1-18]|uniref:beta-ketoacyl-ACP synthase III n=1 Tax=unclassified Dysgonomonas TaxID=2630389 RepID=UPI00247362EC|nr:MULTISPECIES: beta-ketoacyl-ACP synthase III [unclassified Dysgonomonas]MDH6307905.1 3-oxoacyl-[acyl-carrier-protein] synthase-3 [Dysgonomonas sp. PF1-14]MDH6337823.1 3-oxoacyl-[acyl-carrier-protein] synthase-3 [Dysgonomonas sp. PF1-16]MDH6379047.1 3-oxoacyl-[acyl-carrier-protein] synthase-3 [Dysgonomonas sp. PFB1-18]MDH6396682.1 3-oxoacyl-[acyl-carrier-protein] synthase-3 [Dysgonomonas sp. PF1-23]